MFLTYNSWHCLHREPTYLYMFLTSNSWHCLHRELAGLAAICISSRWRCQHWIFFYVRTGHLPFGIDWVARRVLSFIKKKEQIHIPKDWLYASRAISGISWVWWLQLGATFFNHRRPVFSCPGNLRRQFWSCP